MSVGVLGAGAILEADEPNGSDVTVFVDGAE